MASFPSLPDGPWPFNVRQQHERLETAHQSICNALAQEDNDSSRLRRYRNQIESHWVPALVALEQTQQFSKDWLVQATRSFIDLEPILDKAIVASQEREDAQIRRIQPISSIRTGHRGRPQLQIDDAFILREFAPDRNNSIREVAASLGIDRRVLKREIDRVGVERAFSDITDDELDELVRVIYEQRPGEGFSYVLGELRGHHFRVQQSRVKASLRRVDPSHYAARPPRNSRVYSVTRPNKVWHGDGYHKLIRWGFVLHGFADGYSRMIVGMKVNTNNRAMTVLQLFLRAVDEHGRPSRTRGDRGGENIEVAVWMVIHQGPNRGSYLWGSSTRNTRIERLWLEVGKQFARRWRAFFMRLERLHFLDAEDKHHLWLLHYVFLDMLQKDCDGFVRRWNHHPVRTGPRARSDGARGTHKGNKAPIDMFSQGRLDYGAYEDKDLDDISPEILQRYYSVNRPYPANRRSGAGESDGEEADSDDEMADELDNDEEEALADADYDMDELESFVAEHQQGNLRHEGVEVPEGVCPFTDDQLDLFRASFSEVAHSGIVPLLYGVAEDEWEDGEYPDSESLKIAGKATDIELPVTVWWPRAVRWVQALDVMIRILDS